MRDRIATLHSRIGNSAIQVCVGFSGGLDSSVLLHLLAAIAADCRLVVSALHVNHGLSPNADAWESHCAITCSRSDIALQIERPKVSRGPGQSLEEQARIARFGAFAMSNAAVIALAHHADDQAETVILQMLRGAGPKGLAAMPEYSATGGMPGVWRPLLNTPRAELLAYAKAFDLGWVEDESNQDTDFKRNFLRRRIWPMLEEGFPAPSRMIARVAGLQAEAAALLDELADSDLADLVCEDGLDCLRLKALSARRQANLLRRWISRHGARAPSAARLAALCRALADTSNDTRLTWNHEHLTVFRRRARLLIATRPVPPDR